MTHIIQSQKVWPALRKSQWVALLLALGFTGPTPLQAQVPAAEPVRAARPSNLQLPMLGDSSEMPSGAERRLGDRIAREIYRDPDYIDDPVLVEYVQGIWQPLLAAARARGDLSTELNERFAWEFMLGRDRTVNAFALPGGYLGVHLGLIAVVSSRDELASVLGHELSHITQRHISRLMSKQGQQTPWMLAAMILGALAASKSADAGSALIVGGQAVAAQNQLNFSRDMEREADRVGFGVMTEADFEAQGFVSMFDKLQQASRLNDNGAYPYLRTHPLTTERIADMQSRLPLTAASSVAPKLTAEHAMITARARVLSNPGVDNLRAIAQEAQGVQLAALAIPRQAGVLYGAALSSSRLRDFANTKDCLRRLQALVRDDVRALRLVHLLDAEIALAEGDAGHASAVLNASAVGSNDTLGTRQAQQRPELFLKAQLAVQTGQAGQLGEVAQQLQVWVIDHPRDAQAWQLLSSANAAQGLTLRAIRADAEAQAARLDYAAALERFKAAQELSRQARNSGAAADHIDASIIDTRRRQLELLSKELTKEQALER